MNIINCRVPVVFLVQLYLRIIIIIIRRISCSKLHRLWGAGLLPQSKSPRNSGAYSLRLSVAELSRRHRIQLIHPSLTPSLSLLLLLLHFYFFSFPFNIITDNTVSNTVTLLKPLLSIIQILPPLSLTLNNTFRLSLVRNFGLFLQLQIPSPD